MAEFKESWRALQRAQHSAKGAPLVLRFVVRPLGRVFAAAAHTVGLAPNHVTVISGLVTLAGIAVVGLVEPSAASGVLAALLLILGFGLDAADGQVARLSATTSLVGEWLDHVMDAGKMVLIHTAVLVGWYRFTDLGEGWLVVPLAFQVVAVVTFTGLTLVLLLKKLGADPGAPRPSAEPPSLVRSMGLLPADYGVLCFAFVLWGSVTLFSVVYLVLLVLNAVILVLFTVKWIWELRAVDGRRRRDPSA